MRKFILFSSLLISSVIFGDVLTEEGLMKMSSEELRILHREKLVELKDTLECQRVSVQRNNFMQARKKCADAMYSCHMSKSWTCFFCGSAGDCLRLEELEKELAYQGALLQYADQELDKSNPDLKLIKCCVLKKSYSSIEVKQD